jgi:hypothetical protein
MKSPERFPKVRHEQLRLFRRGKVEQTNASCSRASASEDSAQEISERRSPDKHAMGAGNDGVAVADV